MKGLGQISGVKGLIDQFVFDLPYRSRDRRKRKGDRLSSIYLLRVICYISDLLAVCCAMRVVCFVTRDRLYATYHNISIYIYMQHVMCICRMFRAFCLHNISDMPYAECHLTYIMCYMS